MISAWPSRPVREPESAASPRFDGASDGQQREQGSAIRQMMAGVRPTGACRHPPTCGNRRVTPWRRVTPPEPGEGARAFSCPDDTDGVGVLVGVEVRHNLGVAAVGR
jgi:hypothetical protein